MAVVQPLNSSISAFCLLNEEEVILWCACDGKEYQSTLKRDEKVNSDLLKYHEWSTVLNIDKLYTSDGERAIVPNYPTPQLLLDDVKYCELLRNVLLNHVFPVMLYIPPRH